MKKCLLVFTFIMMGQFSLANEIRFQCQDERSPQKMGSMPKVVQQNIYVGEDSFLVEIIQSRLVEAPELFQIVNSMPTHGGTLYFGVSGESSRRKAFVFVSESFQLIFEYSAIEPEDQILNRVFEKIENGKSNCQMI